MSIKPHYPYPLNTDKVEELCLKYNFPKVNKDIYEQLQKLIKLKKGKELSRLSQLEQFEMKSQNECKMLLD